MAIKLSSKPNAVAPNSTYPYGAIQDDTGGGNGVPVNTVVYGDFHQFFASLMAAAGAVYNGQPDEGAYNGGLQQYYAALIAVIQGALVNMKASQATVNTGTDDATYVTPLKLLTNLRNYTVSLIGASIVNAIRALQDQAWTDYTPTFTGDISSTSAVHFRWRPIGTNSPKTIIISFTLTGTSSSGNFTFTLPTTNSGASFYGAGNIVVITVIPTETPGIMFVTPNSATVTASTITNGSAQLIYGQITVEIQ